MSAGATGASSARPSRTSVTSATGAAIEMAGGPASPIKVQVLFSALLIQLSQGKDDIISFRRTFVRRNFNPLLIFQPITMHHRDHDC